MGKQRSAASVFDDWVTKYDGGVGMELEHWPQVAQVLPITAYGTGNYLEIGPGNGYSLEYMARNNFSRGECFGLDVSQNMLEICRSRCKKLENVHLDCGDFLEWLPPVVQFDLIFSMEVFYYFDNIQSGIDKAASLLSSNGKLIVMVDYFEENQDSHSWPASTGTAMNLWSKVDYLQGFTSAGLDCIEQKTIRNKCSQDSITLCTTGICANPN